MSMKRIAVLTSGGDSPGMNAALRAVVRVGISKGAEVMGVRDGYAGLVAGGDAIFPLGWRDVGGVLQRGGTFIGTARCEEFRAQEGQRKALGNLKKLDIDGLIVVGGDGSLTGARIVDDMGIPTYGIPGTIDNDLPGTDMAIGVDTALNTVVRDIDMLVDTAASHRRTFIIEVMGNKSGYLALMAGLATGAEGILVPEERIGLDDLKSLIKTIQDGYRMGKRQGIVVAAEGAEHDVQFLRSFIERFSEPPIQVRTTIPGHVQRGGCPSAFDRVLATRLGAAAVERLLAGERRAMAGLVDGRVVSTCLDDVLEQNRTSRGRTRRTDVAGLLDLAVLLSTGDVRPSSDGKAIGILTAGADAPGMNAAIRAATRVAIDKGLRVCGILNGLTGLAEGKTRELGWMSVDGIASTGGSILGTSPADRLLDVDVEGAQGTVQRNQLAGLVVIGGREVVEDGEYLCAATGVPVVFVPASIHNDLPEAGVCIGADTALNTAMSAIDKIKESASSQQRVLMVETMGMQSGYLALMSSLASGAEQVFIPEDPARWERLKEYVQALKEGYLRGKKHGIVVFSEGESRRLGLEFVSKFFEQEGGFETRTTVLGHIQRGGPTSAFDRVLAARLGAQATAALVDLADTGEKGAYIVAASSVVPTVRRVGESVEEGHRESFLNLLELERLLAMPR